MFRDIQKRLDGCLHPAFFVQPVLQHFAEKGIQGRITFRCKNPRCANQISGETDRDIPHFHEISVTRNPCDLEKCQGVSASGSYSKQDGNI